MACRGGPTHPPTLSVGLSFGRGDNPVARFLASFSLAHVGRLEEYDSLRELVDALPQGAAELAELGSMFESVGLGEDSVRALLRLGDPKAAIDSCIRLNHWERCATLELTTPRLAAKSSSIRFDWS